MKTTVVTRTATVTFDVPGRTIPALTVRVPCVADLVAAVLAHARPHLPVTQPVYAVVNPDGRGYLWDGRRAVGTLHVTWGAW